MDDIDGVLVAPGFGERGIEGKIESIKYVRENKIPFFGICLGMQMAVIEFSRNVLGLEDANSSEMDSDSLTMLLTLWKIKNRFKQRRDYAIGFWSCELLMIL